MQRSVLEAKKSLYRLQLRRRLIKLDDMTRRRRSLRISEELIHHPVFLKAKKILVYLPTSEEVNIKPVIRAALRLKKEVFVPVVHSQKKSIALGKIQTVKMKFKKNIYGIHQPPRTAFLKPAQLDLILVPGIGFDKSGRRLGRGAGYYDRFLKKTKRAIKIGIAFREQIINILPHQPHDVDMNQVMAA